MKRFGVNIIESERDWGQRVDRVKTFDTIEEAEKFVDDFNSRNCGTIVPDWYMYACDPHVIPREL